MVVGGGLAGMAASVKLGDAGFEVDLHEARPFLGGRCCSFPVDPSDPDSPTIDNGDHVTLDCFTALLDFYRRCDASRFLKFHESVYLQLPGGQPEALSADPLPKPFHLARSLARLRCLGWSDKASLIRISLAAQREHGRRPDLDYITCMDWLQEKAATPRLIARFLGPLVSSALNEDLDRAAAAPALKVLVEGLLGSRTSFRIGQLTVPFGHVYHRAVDQRLWPSVNVHLRSKVTRIDARASEADYYVSAVSHHAVPSLLPGLGLDGLVERFGHSPIVNVHLWYDREFTDLPHCMLLESDLHFLFNKGDGYYTVTVSASRALEREPASSIVELASHCLREYFPVLAEARLLRSKVVKEVRATFSSKPGLDPVRPGPSSAAPNVFLAGDWTNTGWPATQESAVRSGYAAAEAVIAAAN